MVRDVLDGARQLGEAWRAEVMRRKYEKLVKTVEVMQRLAKCTLASYFLQQNVQTLTATRKVQDAWRDWRSRQEWLKLVQQVIQERQMRRAVSMVKAVWRRKHLQWRWLNLVDDLRDRKIKSMINGMRHAVVGGKRWQSFLGYVLLGSDRCCVLNLTWRVCSSCVPWD